MRTAWDLPPWSADRHALGSQVIGQAVHAGLRADEEDRATVAGSDLRRDLVLVGRVHEEHVVVHRVDLRVDGCDGVRRGVAQVPAHQGVDVTVERRAEQQPLPVRLRHVEDLAHDRQEAHVRHLVRLVEDGDGHLGQVHVAAVDEIDEAPRRRATSTVTPRSRLRICLEYGMPPAISRTLRPQVCASGLRVSLTCMAGSLAGWGRARGRADASPRHAAP